MTNHSGDSQIITPRVTELKCLLESLPDQGLMAALKTYYAGRRGYGHIVLWRTYVTQSYMNLPSFAALMRALHDNQSLRDACGIDSIEAVPSKFAYSRFLRKLQGVKALPRVKDVFRELVRRCQQRFPEYAKSVSIDSTDLKAWSNGRHKVPTDPDAGWVVKEDTAGKRKYVWGYKAHVAVCTTTELPVGAHISSGNVHDTQRASHVLREARFALGGKFRPKYVIGDAGYSDRALRHLIRDQYWAKAIIKVNRGHKVAMKLNPETEEFRRVYNRRTAVERLFSRLKGHRRFNSITVRRRWKVTVHCFVPLIVTLAVALLAPVNPDWVVQSRLEQVVS